MSILQEHMGSYLLAISQRNNFFCYFDYDNVLKWFWFITLCNGRSWRDKSSENRAKFMTLVFDRLLSTNTWRFRYFNKSEMKIHHHGRTRPNFGSWIKVEMHFWLALLLLVVKTFSKVRSPFLFLLKLM